MAPDGWLSCRLGDVLQIKHGWPFKSELFSEKLTGRPIVVSVGNYRYTGGFRFGETSLKEYRGSYPGEFELSPQDILLVMTCQTPGGEILGIPARIPEDGRRYLHNQRLGKVVVRDHVAVEAGFLYWLFLSPAFNRALVSSASGTKILHTAPSRIEAFAFSLPPIAEQRSIAHVLGTLDDKIDLNRRMSETLEAMARALFKSWFVDFDPVRAKAEGRDPGLPKHLADLFPGSFEDSALGEVPRGWRVSRLGNEAVTLLGGTPSRAEPDFWGGDVPWINSGKANEFRIIEPSEFITRKGLDSSATKMLPRRTTVIAITGATLGQVSLTEIETAANQSVVGVPGSAALPSEFIYFWIKERIAQLVAHQTGGAQQHINKNNVNDLPTLCPSDPVLAKYVTHVRALFDRIGVCVFQSRTLATLRDVLLPKLISGELRVPDAEAAIKAHA